MISVGTSVISSIKVGTITPTRINVGPTKVWPTTGYYVIPSDTEITVSSASTADTVVVTSNTSWTANVSGGSWLTIVSTSNTGVTYSVTANQNEYERSSYILYKIGGVTCADTKVTQEEAVYPYVFNVNTNNPLSVTSAQTAFTIVISSARNNSPLQPSYTIGGNSMGVAYSGMSQASTTYIYFFTCNANSTTSERSVDITFTQTRPHGQQASIVVTVTQDAKYVPTPPSGLTTAGTPSNGWFIGTYATTGNERALAIMRKDLPSGTKYASYDVLCAYATGGSAYINTATTFTGTNVAITTGSTISIPNGDSGYGIVIDAKPYMSIGNVNSFNVSS